MKLSAHFLCDGCRRKKGEPHAPDCKLVKPPERKAQKRLSSTQADRLGRYMARR